MIHTLQISYGITLKVANTCTYRLNERTHKYDEKMYMITNYLDKDQKKLGHLVFKVSEFPGIKSVTMVKYVDHDDNLKYRIYFLIEAEILRTGIDTLDLFFCSPEHAKQLQTQYAKAIYSLFPESFTGRPASQLSNTNFAPKDSYLPDEYENFNGGLYSLPYLPLASIRRIDFTFDYESKDEEHARLFTEMAGISYYDGHKKNEKAGKNPNEHSQEKCYDIEYASGLRGFSVYYKYDKMASKAYDDRPNIIPIRAQSRNITRIEMPIKSPNRKTLRSLTTLRIPSDGIPLGPLPYLANEQVTINLFSMEFIGRVGNYENLKWLTRDDFDKHVNELMRDKTISKTVGSGMIKMSQKISKHGSINKYVKALKEYNVSIRGKNIKKKDRKYPSIGTFFNYKKIAMRNHLMLTTIPASRSLKELSLSLLLRNYDFDDLNSVITTYMLPYESVMESAPGLEPVKDLYDAILSFLYGKYDEYNASWNSKIEESSITVTEENKELYGL